MKFIWILILCTFGLTTVLSDYESLQALVERLNALETQVEDLKKYISNTNLATNDDTLEQRVEKLEELSKVKNLRTCQELSNRGITQSGIYKIDPDGDGIGFGPITVFCNFQTNETSIYHDKEDVIKIEKCDSEGCAVYEFNYDAPKEQIQALVDLSDTCYQDISFGCFLAPLRFEGVDLGFWSDKNGDFQYFFHGEGLDHTCQCGTDESCVDSTIENLKCNCDAKVSSNFVSDLSENNL